MAKKLNYKNNPNIGDFDGALFMRNEQMMADYLNDELINGDPHYVKVALETIARARNMAELSKRAGISRSGLYKVFAPDSRPEYATIQKIVNALDMRLMVVPKV
ncbi:MAG: putative addiction module antidote protein [Rickettsiales bacterium]|jgi:probable addiction module antidote protein|nr:putative addiction module antidote protein [Rickettsiales bacterium]